MRILFYLLFGSRNNMPFAELLSFLSKPPVKEITKPFIEEFRSNSEEYEISFKGVMHRLFWSKIFTIDGIYQVTTGTFDKTTS